MNKLFVKFKMNFYLLKTSDDSFLFIGKLSRVTEYLEPSKYTVTQLGIGVAVFLKILLILCYFSLRCKHPIVCSINLLLLKFLVNLFKIIKHKEVSSVLSTVHEYRNSYGFLASKLDVKMLCLQDSFLPNYYPSAYLKYYTQIDNFLIWDCLSEGIFKEHDLNYKVWNCYKKTNLPLLDKINKVRCVVFIASGSGDWTALKNRSDEDLSFIAFVEASKFFPDITFIYRPHPFWEHPEHQGVGSIQRLKNYCNQLSLNNFFISSNDCCEKLSNKQLLSKSNNIGLNNVADDIDSADVVFGDHSQLMLVASRKKKIIATVSLANRLEFFCGYTNLGFPILRSSKDIVTFIKQVQINPHFIENYNKAISAHNRRVSC